MFKIHEIKLKKLKREEKGIIIKINIQRNDESECKILYLGEIRKVLEPKKFSKKIKQRLGENYFKLLIFENCHCERLEAICEIDASKFKMFCP